MVNDFVEAIAAFFAMPETRQIAQPKELSATNINRKGQNRLNAKYPIVYFCNCERNHRFAAIIIFDCVLIPFPSQVITIICGKILCEHYRS